MAESIESLTTLAQVEYQQEIALLDQARAAISEATTVRDAKEIRDRAEALEVYAKRAEYGSILQDKCAEIKLRAERRAGELLSQMGVQRGRPSAEAIETGAHQTLDSMGITRKQSSRWQRLATIPPDDFEEELTRTLSEAALLRLAKRLDDPPPPPPEPHPFPEPPAFVARPYEGLEDYGVSTVLLNEDTGEVVAYFCDANKAREVAVLLN